MKNCIYCYITVCNYILQYLYSIFYTAFCGLVIVKRHFTIRLNQIFTVMLVKATIKYVIWSANPSTLYILIVHLNILILTKCVSLKKRNKKKCHLLSQYVYLNDYVKLKRLNLGVMYTNVQCYPLDITTCCYSCLYCPLSVNQLETTFK